MENLFFLIKELCLEIKKKYPNQLLFQFFKVKLTVLGERIFFLLIFFLILAIKINAQLEKTRSVLKLNGIKK